MQLVDTTVEKNIRIVTGVGKSWYKGLDKWEQIKIVVCDTCNIPSNFSLSKVVLHSGCNSFFNLITLIKWYGNTLLYFHWWWKDNKNNIEYYPNWNIMSTKTFNKKQLRSNLIEKSWLLYCPLHNSRSAMLRSIFSSCTQMRESRVVFGSLENPQKASIYYLFIYNFIFV